MKLEEILDEKKIRYNEPMSKHTTMRVGGCVDIMVIPEKTEDIILTLRYAKENNIPFKILGFGSNVIVSDEGLEGIVIKMTNKLEKITIDGDEITASVGTSMPKLATVAKDNSLTGFEFACGIPGTIGGGVRMNAGAYGGEIKDVLVSVKFLDENLDIKEIETKDMQFGYRESIFKNNKNYVILEATFKFNKGDVNEITEAMKKNREARVSKQPLNYPNTGSIFKRPEGYFAGKLISDCNLKGVNIGDAMVSTKHAGFIINTGKATCKDIKELILLIQKTIKEKFNVDIETEVEFIGK